MNKSTILLKINANHINFAFWTERGLVGLPYFMRDSLFDFYNIKVGDVLQLQLKKRFVREQQEQYTIKGSKTITMKQEQKYIKKIKYQAHKLPAFYNQSTVPTKKQNNQHFLYQSIIQIQSPLDLVLSIDELLNIERKQTKMMLPPLTHTCSKIASELRLGLEWSHQCDLQALKKQQQTLIESLSSRNQIKSVHLKKNSQRNFYKISFYCLSRWLIQKLFEESHQIYALFIVSDQQKSITFLHDRKINFLQISPNQYLVYPELTVAVEKSERQLKQEYFFEDLFGSLFTHNNNLAVTRLTHPKIKEILDQLSQNAQLVQFKVQNKSYQQFTSTLSNFSIKINNENRQEVRKFLLQNLSKIQKYNISKTPSFSSHLFLKDRLNADMQRPYNQKKMSLINQPSLLTTIQIANKQLRQNGFFSLQRAWKYVLRPKIQDILCNFQMFEANLNDHLLLFARLHQLSILKIQQYLKKSVLKCLLKQQVKIIYETIYPNITNIIQTILQKVGAQKLKSYRQKFKQQNKSRGMSSDKLQADFVPIIGKQLGCSEHIANQMLVLQRIKQFVIESHHINQNKTDHSLSLATYFAEIQNERLMNNTCLGCATFFYQNMNVYQPTLNQTPSKFFKDINIVKENNAQLIESICAMLNYGGGIILFGFQNSQGQNKTIGKMISQRQKQMIEDRITPVMGLIYPKVDQKDWAFSFIPLYKNPLLQKAQDLNRVSYTGNQQLLKPNQSYIGRTPLKGVYVCRLILKPIDNTKFYMYSFRKQKSNEKTYTNILENGQIKFIPIHKIRRIIKKKIKAHLIPEELKIYQNSYLKTDKVFDHECIPPESGKLYIQTKLTALHPYLKKSCGEKVVDCPQNKVSTKKVSKKQANL